MTTEEFRNCIYCQKTKTANLFNKEHVLHRSMVRGKSIQNNLTLQPAEFKNCVCEECNKSFSTSIDEVLGKDSLEALLRIHHGMKPLNEIGDLPLDRTKLMSSDPKENGAELAIRTDEKGPILYPFPQVVFRKKSGEGYERCSVSELEAFLTANETQLDLESFELHTSDTADDEVVESAKAEVAKVIAARGKPASFGESKHFPADPCNRFHVVVTVDDALSRAIAKIAFNYAAYALKAVHEGIILNDAFDDARRFIRYGTRPVSNLLFPSNRPILVETSSTDGHLVVIEMIRQKFIARVSLFNQITWEVVLSNTYRGPILDFESAHHWDFERGLCTKLSVGSKTRLPSVHLL